MFNLRSSLSWVKDFLFGIYHSCGKFGSEYFVIYFSQVMMTRTAAIWGRYTITWCTDMKCWKCLAKGPLAKWSKRWITRPDNMWLSKLYVTKRGTKQLHVKWMVIWAFMRRRMVCALNYKSIGPGRIKEQGGRNAVVRAHDPLTNKLISYRGIGLELVSPTRRIRKCFVCSMFESWNCWFSSLPWKSFPGSPIFLDIQKNQHSKL